MRARILIVDDDQAYLAGMKELLEEAGYEVFLAGNFEDGKHVLRDRTPDLLIVDVRLGAFNGLQLISTGQVQIPAIVVTGFDDTVLRADASVFGASYLVKPISPSALLALIDQKLGLADQGGSESILEQDTSSGIPSMAEHAGQSLRDSD
jgi:DNA-binding response OmpR family regulator